MEKKLYNYLYNAVAQKDDEQNVLYPLHVEGLFIGGGEGLKLKNTFVSICRIVRLCRMRSACVMNA